MRFSVEKFRKNAEHAIRKRVPQPHLDILDGMEVTRDTLEYQVDGEKFYLFPVYPEWCEEEEL
ncbi:hypothetical protein [Novisyntrophococcus fermenticellae]|uniref:hypothetical protein n=1 Tax=Novisyntrophococcus fermenticellae TaxID=2068655 RepID=UPI001E5DE4AF|nr:hypothetical protein [Novisyntrophococcus fermenticellae]